MEPSEIHRFNKRPLYQKLAARTSQWHAARVDGGQRCIWMSATFVRYTDSVEVVQPDEEQTFDDIAATMQDIASKIGDRQRHTVRAVHAKSHALLKAELTVRDGLPEPLRQGLFARTGSYGTVMRFSTNPGDILSDHISSPRGLAIKVVGVEGETVPSHAGEVTQDFVMVNAKAFETKDAKGFLKNLKVLDKHANDSEALKQVVSTTTRIAENVLEAVGGESATLKDFGHPATNPLGETYATLIALRHGDYFGKVAVVPVSPNLVELHKKHLPNASHWNALKEEFSRFFQENTAVWELRVQLCTDLEKMPVEDGTVEWDEKASPYVTVAQLTAPPQDVYSDARRVWVDEELSFNPWHCLAAHRPLGNLMRARFKAYALSTKFRHAAEGRKMTEPRSINEMPA